MKGGHGSIEDVRFEGETENADAVSEDDIKDDCEDAYEDKEFGINDNDDPPSHVDESSSSNESVHTNNGEHKFHLNDDDLSRYKSNDEDERLKCNFVSRRMT